MKGVKNLCCGLLLVFFITLGLLLNASSDVSALRHEVNIIPIANVQLGSHHLYQALSVFYREPYTVTFDNVASPRLFGSSYNTSTNTCSYYSSAWDYSFYNGGDVSFTSFLSQDTSRITGLGSPICRNLRPFDSTVSVDINSLPSYSFGRPDFRSMLPYWYDYDGYYLKAKQASPSTGESLSYIFKFSDVYGMPLNKFASLRIPLGYVDDSVIGSSRISRPMRFEGSFNFSGSGNYLNLSEQFSNNGTFDLLVDYSDSSGTNTHVQRVSCSSNLVSLGANDFIELQFTCPFDIAYDLPYIGFTIELSVPYNSSDPDGSYVWDTNADYTFNSSFFVTDNDDSPGSSVLPHEVTGGNLELSPSARYFSSLTADEDWFTKLVNGFDFGFINPFAPIFNLFTNNESCANIPTMAAMLHSESSTVCPWFDSNTRNIVTPVLGLSSMMLVFGFAVRWLGSRSGNFIEDAEADAGGLHFASKYRRKK